MFYGTGNFSYTLDLVLRVLTQTERAENKLAESMLMDGYIDTLDSRRKGSV